MSITSYIRVIHRVDKIVTDLKADYFNNPPASLELRKLGDSLKQLEAYLHGLDQLKPNYRTNEVNSLLDSVNLHLDILKGEIDASDYKKLNKGVKAIKTLLRFHPTHYTFFTFIVAWFTEWVYFI